MNLFKTLSIYTLSSLISRSIPFLMLPIMTKYLSPEQYGVVATVMVLVTLVSSPLFVGIHSYININFFKLGQQEHLRLVSTLIRIPVVLLLPITAIFYIYISFGGDTWSIPREWFICIPLLAMMTFFYRLVTILFRVKEQAGYFGIVEVFYSASQVGLALLFVVAWSKGLEGRLWSIFFSSFFINALAIFVLFKQGYLTNGFHKSFIKGSMKYGLGIIPHELGSQLTRMVDRLFIVSLLGTSAVGTYAVAAQVASIGLVALSVFNLAWQPYVFKMLSQDKEETKLQLVRLSWLVLGAFFVFFMLLDYSTPYIYQYFIAEAYHSSIIYVQWLLLGFFFLAIYTLFCDYIFYIQKSYLLSIVTFVNVVFTLMFNYVFITEYGAIGATYAFALSSAFACLMVIVISTHVYPMPWLRFRNV
ncbi:MAG: oligosaccharide flippase family protein [Colwellia sp.]